MEKQVDHKASTIGKHNKRRHNVMKDKRIDKINLSSLIVAIIALGLAVFSTFRSCSSEMEIQKRDYLISSIDYRPRLKLSNPKITMIDLVSDSVPVKKNNDLSDSIGNLYAKVTLKIRIKVTNIGNNSAKIVGYVFTDTISNEQVIKDILKDSNRKNINSKDTLKLPHLYKDLTPIDTTFIELEYCPQLILNNQFMIHLVLYYENELGQLFDTYYWIDYKAKPVIVPNPIFYSQDKAMMEKFAKGIFKVVEFKDENSYSSIYSEEERTEFIEQHNKK